MAHLKHTPKTYAEATGVLQGRDSIKLGNNTWLEAYGNAIIVRLHNTAIVQFYPDGRVLLFSGGYRTVTTKERLNQFTNKRVVQRAHQWFIIGHDEQGAYDFIHPQEFTEGVNVA